MMNFDFPRLSFHSPSLCVCNYKCKGRHKRSNQLRLTKTSVKGGYFLMLQFIFPQFYTISRHSKSVVTCTTMDKSHVESVKANDRSGHLTAVSFISP